MSFEKVAAGVFESLQKGDAVRGEKLARWAVAYDPQNSEAHRNLGLALAMQGKVVDALAHLVKGTREQATQILSGVLYQNGKLPEAMDVLDYASRWYVRADQWLTYGASHTRRWTTRARQGICARVPARSRGVRCDAAQRIRRRARRGRRLRDCARRVAKHLLRIAGRRSDVATNAWNHLACAYIGSRQVRRRDRCSPNARQATIRCPTTRGVRATLDARARQTKSRPPAHRPTRRANRSTRCSRRAITPRGAAPADPTGACAARAARARVSRSRRKTGRGHARVHAPQRWPFSPIRSARWIAKHCLPAPVALQIREQAYFARDPVPHLGDRMTREAFYQEFRARGGVVLGEEGPPPPAFVDRVVVAGGRIERASDYVSLLRDLAQLAPKDALAQFDLDEASYLEVATAWGRGDGSGSDAREDDRDRPREAKLSRQATVDNHQRARRERRGVREQVDRRAGDLLQAARGARAACA
jgi:hypothetical protein